jgi:hypothetical protein
LFLHVWSQIQPEPEPRPLFGFLENLVSKVQHFLWVATDSSSLEYSSFLIFENWDVDFMNMAELAIDEKFKIPESFMNQLQH